MARADKVTAVAELAENFRSSQAAVLTEYRGLTVAHLAELREKLNGVATYSVVKNTLTKIAAREAGVPSFDDLLVGPSAIAFVQGDPVLAAKGLRDFAKTHPLLIIKGGVLEGALLNPQELSRLADLDSREVLLAKLAGAMKASLSGAAALFQAPLSKAVRTMEALRAKLEQDSGTSAAAAESTADVDAADDAPSGEAEGADAPSAEGADSAVVTDGTEDGESVAAPDTAATDTAAPDSVATDTAGTDTADTDSAETGAEADTAATDSSATDSTETESVEGTAGADDTGTPNN